jgi:hypothetical protein
MMLLTLLIPWYRSYLTSDTLEIIPLPARANSGASDFIIIGRQRIERDSPNIPRLLPLCHNFNVPMNTHGITKQSLIQTLTFKIACINVDIGFMPVVFLHAAKQPFTHSFVNSDLSLLLKQTSMKQVLVL